MDDFERDLIQMLRQPQDPRPFEPRHRERLWAAVRARRRVRTQRIVAGSVVAAVVCAVGLVLLPRAVDAGPGPAGPPATTVPTTPPDGSLPQTPQPTSMPSSSSSSSTKVAVSTSATGGPSSGLPDPTSTNTSSATGPTTSRIGP